MAESLAEFYARNLAEQIRRAAGNEYAKWALQARSKYIDLRLRQDGEIRKLYLKAAEEAQKLLGRRNRWPSDIVLRNRLGHIIANLNEIADTLRGDLEALLRRDITKAVEAGAAYSQAVTMRLLGDAGFSSGELRRIFARVNQQAVEACWARTKNGLFLSDRIWQQGEQVRDAMKEIIQTGVALGMDAKDIAWALEQYVRSDAATLARQYPNMMKRMGKRIPKNLTYEALRLARTEMTAAFGEGTIAAARVSPSYRGMKWVLSKAHPLPDICDTLASVNDYGLGEGVYPPGNEPMYPAHPNCLCVLVPVHEDPDAFQERLRRWLENPANEPDLERWYNEVYTKQAIRQVARPQVVIRPRPELYVEVEDLPEEARIGLAEAWEIARNHGLANGTETILHVSSQTGAQVVAREVGGPSGIKFPKELVQFLKAAAPDSVLSIHNHPNSSSFSPEDMQVMCDFPSIRYITVVGHDGTRYLLRAGNGHRPIRETLFFGYYMLKNEYRWEYDRLIKSGRMTEAEAWREISHRIVRRLAQEFGWTYRRIGPDGRED